MAETHNDRKWILAVLTAVLFPVLALHSTCIAVMGPGTWGSGLEEVHPVFHPLSQRVLDYAREFEALPTHRPLASNPIDPPQEVELRGSVTWSHGAQGRAVFLTEEGMPRSKLQHLYISDEAGVREVALVPTHFVVRPQWAGNRIIYERWNPWAIPPIQKVRRYLASWIDPALRPEATLYGSASPPQAWTYLMPGHSLVVAPDGSRAAFLRSGALLAGYYSIHIWQLEDLEAPGILSLREHREEGTRSFSLQWSADSVALQIQGRTSGLSRRESRGGSEGIAFRVLYLADKEELYDLAGGL